MSDFSDLWASSNPVKSQKPASTSLAAAQANIINNSRASTPDTFNLFASTHSSRANSRPITPAAIQSLHIAHPRPSSSNGDAFGGLVSLGSKGLSLGNLTIAERAALAERSRQHKKKDDVAFDSHASFWDQFENQVPQKVPTQKVPTRETNHDANGLDLDFLAETSQQPLQPQNVAPANNHDLFWNLEPVPSGHVTEAVVTISDSFDNSSPSTSLTSQPSLIDSSHSSKPNITHVWDDDILGDLAKPVPTLKGELKRSTPSRDLRTASGTKKIQRSLTSPPHITGRIVEMGFSIDQARTALAATDSGIDVDSALEILLQDTNSVVELPHTDSNDDAVKSKPLTSQRRTSTSVEESSRTSTPSINHQGLQEQADKLISQASSIGLSVFNRANAIWKEGRDKVVKVYEEQRVVATGSEINRSRHQPKWMDSQIGGRSVDESSYVSTEKSLASSATVPARASSPNTAASSFSPSPVALSPLTRPSIPLSPAELSASNNHKSFGTEHFKLGRFAEAEDAYSRALDALPPSHLLRISLLNNRAVTRLKTGQFKGTIDDATEVLNLITLEFGESWHPEMESSIDDRQSFGNAVGKALRRRAEAFEGLEKWKDALSDWNRLNGATWVHVTLKKDAIAGLSRCRRMIVGPSVRGSSQKTQISKKLAVVNHPEEALSRLRATNQAQEAEEQARYDLKDIIDTRIQAWRTGKENNIRALIASLDTILSPSFRWQKVGMAELVTPSQVKIRYNKAIAKVHPDKLNASNTTLEERMVANSVFSTLNEAMHTFR